MSQNQPHAKISSAMANSAATSVNTQGGPGTHHPLGVAGWQSHHACPGHPPLSPDYQLPKHRQPPLPYHSASAHTSPSDASHVPDAPGASLAHAPVPRHTAQNHPSRKVCRTLYRYPTRAPSPYLPLNPPKQESHPVPDGLYGTQAAVSPHRYTQPKQEYMPVHYQGIPSQYPPGAAARHAHSAPTGPTQFSQPPLGSHYAGQPGVLAGSLGSPASGVSRSYSRSMLSAEEKELRRKVSHSAIEKRRRERTNAVLRDLQDMVPGIPKFGKIQKLEILEGAAEYIRQLRVSVDQQQQQVFTPGAQPWQQQSKQPGGCNGHCTNTHPTSHARQCERDLSCSHSVDTQAPDSSLPRVQSPLQVNHLRPTAAHIGSPTSVSSGMSRDGSGDDTLANPADSPASPHPPASSDDDSMKVKFLIA